MARFLHGQRLLSRAMLHWNGAAYGHPEATLKPPLGSLVANR
jgi:hypothetical protein